MTITFNYLRELQKKEKTSNELQKIEPGFYELVRQYMKRKKQLAEADREGSFFETRKIEHAKAIVEDIFNRRRRKIMEGAMLSFISKDIEIKNLLPDEELLMDDIKKILEKHSIIRLKSHDEEQKQAKTGKIAEKDKPKSLNMLKLKILCDLPAFVDGQLNEHGPFSKGIIVELPKNAGEILLNANKAEVYDD